MDSRKELTNKLMDILFLEREAAYRRLRGEVHFSFNEIILLSRAFQISMDNVIRLGHTHKSSPCELVYIDYLFRPSEEDYRMMEGLISILSRLKDHPESESAIVTNTLPQIFYVTSLPLYKLVLLKWAFQQGAPERTLKYSQIHPPRRLLEINEVYSREIRQMGLTNIVLDKNIFRFVTNDIRFFEEISLISRPEIEEIKEDFFRLLDEMEEIARKGCFATGKKVQMYVSQVDLPNSMTYISLNEMTRLCMLKWFTIIDTVSADEKSFQRMKSWTKALQRASILISETGEEHRIHFFKAQREIVSQL
ncbi:MAG: hypothetical protein LUF04_11190 [Bacteroides sp.]|nr:hypothetical protein [Bacteroides sp.]